jgi:hypothetical protein
MGTLIFLVFACVAIALIRRALWRSKMERKYGPDWEKLFWYVSTYRRLP